MVRKDFSGKQDNGIVFGGMQGSEEHHFKRCQRSHSGVSDIVETDPAVSAVVTSVGALVPLALRRTAVLFTPALKPLEDVNHRERSD